MSRRSSSHKETTVENIHKKSGGRGNQSLEVTDGEDNFAKCSTPVGATAKNPALRDRKSSQLEDDELNVSGIGLNAADTVSKRGRKIKSTISDKYVVPSVAKTRRGNPSSTCTSQDMDGVADNISVSDKMVAGEGEAENLSVTNPGDSVSGAGGRDVSALSCADESTSTVESKRKNTQKVGSTAVDKQSNSDLNATTGSISNDKLTTDGIRQSVESDAQRLNYVGDESRSDATSSARKRGRGRGRGRPKADTHDYNLSASSPQLEENDISHGSYSGKVKQTSRISYFSSGTEDDSVLQETEPSSVTSTDRGEHKRLQRRSAVLGEFILEPCDSKDDDFKTLAESSKKRRLAAERSKRDSQLECQRSKVSVNERTVSGSSTEIEDNIPQPVPSTKKQGGKARHENKSLHETLCVHCDERFDSLALFKIHLLKQHHRVWSKADPAGTLEPRTVFKRFKRISCLRCDRVFTVFYSYSLHAKFCGREEETQVCEFCQKEVKLYHFDYHVRYYHINKPAAAAEKEQNDSRQLNNASSSNQDEPTLGRSKRKAAEKARTKLREIVDEIDGANLPRMPQLLYLNAGQLPEEFVKKCDTLLTKSKQLRCGVEGCRQNFSDSAQFFEHLFECENRSKFLTHDSEDYTCLECGASFVGKDDIQAHVATHVNKEDNADRDSVADFTEGSSLNSDDDDEEEEELDDESDVVGGRHADRRKKKKGPPSEYIASLKNFYSEFSRDAVFTSWQPVPDMFDEITPEELPRYLPEVQDVRYSIKSSPENVVHLPALPLFGSFLHNNSISVNVGGPVWSAAWCPVGLVNQADQYLCVYTHRTISAKYDNKSCCRDDILLQVYNCGSLCNSSAAVKPRLVYGVVLNCGPVREMKWCPTGVWKKQTSNNSNELVPVRLGLLALATQSGRVEILSLPQCSANEPPIDAVKFHRVTPCATLVQHSTHCSGCLCVDWCWQSDCRYVAAGFADGSVSVWDLQCTSSLLRSYANNQRTVVLRPFRTLSAHTWCVASVAFCQLFSNVIVTVSFDRNIKVWDLREPGSPLFCQHAHLSGKGGKKDDDIDDGSGKSNAGSKSYTGLMRKVVYMLVDSHYFCTASDECYSFERTYGNLFHIDGGHLNRLPMTVHNACTWDISFNNWLNVMAACDSAGVVVASTFPREHNKGRKLRTLLLKAEVVAGGDTTEGVTSEKDNGNSADTSCQTSDPNTVHIMYTDYSKNWQFPQVQMALPKTMPPDPVIGNLLAAQHVVAWNPNVQSFQWLAVGGRSGLLRIIAAKQLDSVPVAKLPKLAT